MGFNLKNKNSSNLASGREAGGFQPQPCRRYQKIWVDFLNNLLGLHSRVVSNSRCDNVYEIPLKTSIYY